ncbi:putative aldouronate transport system permease protein [Paenibacillus rhizosphaerae]|uniref:Putative aldouronate transport system permease protein n=1 Tax=Paenibacillus rhizosphaerae TaxID=297318 RepID=A0A839TF23_9BACL|nr:carbohydrate ABC transporter permease [Paenibacillus rhizosphaerae]MBB3125426.1 putative aldouronate transport system permease protein [Paenibacillus rhizosphaerae]
MRRRKTVEDRVLDTVITAILVVVVFITLYPFYYILLITFNEGTDTAAGGVYLWPRQFTLSNYTYFLQDPKWVKAFGISVLRTVIGTALGILFTCLVAYGLSKRDLVFRSGYFLAVVIAMNFSGGLVAFYIVLRSLGLINNFAVYVVPGMLNLFFLLIAISFFRDIPDELGESARIDGASELHIFARIVLPVSMPLLATMSLFIGSGQWNSWLDSAYFVQDEGLRTLTYRMMQVINQTMVPSGDTQAAAMSRTSVTPFSVQATAMVVSIVPILGVYPFLQKYFVSGMMLGSVKG